MPATSLSGHCLDRRPPAAGPVRLRNRGSQNPFSREVLVQGGSLCEFGFSVSGNHRWVERSDRESDGDGRAPKPQLRQLHRASTADAPAACPGWSRRAVGYPQVGASGANAGSYLGVASARWSSAVLRQPRVCWGIGHNQFVAKRFQRIAAMIPITASGPRP